MSLQIRITHRRRDFVLDVDLEAPDDGVTVLFGPSGAGKSTLLSIVAGLLEPDVGRVRLGETVLLDTEQKVSVPTEARQLGMVFQNARLFPHLSVRGNLLFGDARRTQRASAEEIDHLIDLLGIRGLLDRRPHTLSGGEAQRVAIGRALLSGPRLLLLDEPLSALDGPRRHEVMNCLERLRTERGIPMFYVTHRQEEIARLADHVVLLDAGHCVRSGPVESTLTAIEIEDQLLDTPITIVRATIVAHDDAFGLSDLTCAGGTLAVERMQMPVGSEVRVGIAATDITLARAAPQDVSANNVLEGSVEALRYAGESWADVQLDCAGQPLLARITRRSAQRMAIAPGDRLWALVKSTTLTH